MFKLQISSIAQLAVLSHSDSILQAILAILFMQLKLAVLAHPGLLMQLKLAVLSHPSLLMQLKLAMLFN